jgi:hypothetical protein
MRKRLPVLVVVGSIVSHPAVAQTSAPADPVRWRGALAAGKTVEVIGVLGGVRAVPSEGREVVVEARQSPRDPADSVTFEVVPGDEGVTICAKYPMRRVDDDDETRYMGNGGRRGWEGGPEVCEPGEIGQVNLHRNRTRVQWTVHVPAGVRLVARTVQGDVDAVGLRGDVDANTVDGSVEVSTTGMAEAATVSGNIRVRLLGPRVTRELDFRTVSGTIDVTLPQGADAEVRASSMSGSISADFPLEQRGGRSIMGGGRVHGVVGRGGSTLYAQTLSGRIRFRVAER